MFIVTKLSTETVDEIGFRAKRISMKYNVQMFRPSERTHNETLTLTTPVKIVVSFRLGHQNGFAMLAREMVARNLPDGHFVVSDPQHPVDPTNRLMDWRTVHEYALLPVGEDPHENWVANNGSTNDPSETETVKRKAGLTANSHEALGKLMRNSSEWANFGGYTKGALVANDYVELFEGRAVVTDAGRAAYAAFSPPEIPVGITAQQNAAFEMLPRPVESLHGRTRNFMLNKGWIFIRNGVVYIANAAPAPYNAKAVDPASLPEEIVELEVEAVEKGLTDYQRIALSLLPCSMEDWVEKVARTVRGRMKTAGWIVIHNGMVYATKTAPEGFRDGSEFEAEPEPAVEIVSSPVVKERMIPLREEWRSILQRVGDGMAPKTWESFHGKTKKALTVKYAAVAVNQNGKPTLTEAGSKAIEIGKLFGSGVSA